jgi:N-acetylmuramoyl-L-alanine amidase
VSTPDEFPRLFVIVVDPGHGGHEPGAVGSSGLAEKTVTLSVALKIKEFLAGPYEVHLTRSEDYRVDIEDRTATANNQRADLFISIHTGGGFSHQSRGFAVFYHRHDTKLESVFPRQPVDAWKTGEKPVTWDSIHHLHTANNKALAKLVHSRLSDRLSPIDTGIHEAPLLVLRGADMPAVLVEIGHLNHPEEEKYLSNPETISAAAQAICEAIQEYFTQSR